MNIKKYIIFENNNFVVFNKPQNISVHSGTNSVYNLIDEIKRFYKNKFLQLCHRLDKDTTGCLILAKNIKFLKAFNYILKNGKVKKEYNTITYGFINNNFDIITKQSILFNYNSKFKENNICINTKCEIIENFGSFSFLKIQLITGKFHQIRIHLSYIGFPIICDSRYGNLNLNKKLNSLGLYNIFLHSKNIFFQCPLTLENFYFEASYHVDFNFIVTILKNFKLK